MGLLACAGCMPASAPVDRAAAPDTTSAVASDRAGSPSTINETALASDELPLARPTPGEPVVAAAAVSPRQAAPGGHITLTLRMRIAIGWHIFAIGQPSDSSMHVPTTLDLALPEGIVADGDWQAPPPERGSGPNAQGPIYQGEVILRRELKVAAGQSPGQLSLPCTVTFQACNDQVCRRPAPIMLRPTVEVVAQ